MQSIQDPAHRKVKVRKKNTYCCVADCSSLIHELAFLFCELRFQEFCRHVGISCSTTTEQSKLHLRREILYVGFGDTRTDSAQEYQL